MYINLDELEVKEVFQGIKIRPVGGEKPMLSFVDIEEGSEVTKHSHPHEQGGIVLFGALEFTIGAETKVLREGDSYIIPPNVPHSVKVVEGPARALDIFSPPREDYL